MQRIEKGFSSLVGCYALTATVAASFLIYGHMASMAHPLQWAGLTQIFAAKWFSGNALHADQILSAIRLAAIDLRERMHATRLYYGVFAAVWIACLLWMQIGRRRRRLAFRRPRVFWILGISLLVFAAAVLYGLGTRGIYPLRIPALVPASDAFAAAFLLALPLITVSLMRPRNGEEFDDRSASDLSAHRLAKLGLGDNISVVPSIEDASPLEMKSEARTGDPLPGVKVSQTEDHAMIAANRLIARATAPVPLEPQPPVELAINTPVAEPVPVTPSKPFLVAPPEPVSVIPSTALALVQAEPIAALVPEPITAEVAEPVEAEAIAIQMSESAVEAPEASYGPLAEPVAEVPAEHSVIEPVAFRVSGLVDEALATDEAIDRSGGSEVEEHVAPAAAETVLTEPIEFQTPEPLALVAEEPVAPVAEEPAAPIVAEHAVTTEHIVAEPIEFRTFEPVALVAEEPVAGVAEEPAAPIPAAHFPAESVAVQASEAIAMEAEEPVAATPVEPVASEAVEFQTLEPVAAMVAAERVAILVAEPAVLQNPEPIAMVAEEPAATASEPVAIAAIEPVVVTVPPVATVIPPKPVTVAHLEPYPVSAATLEQIPMSAEPIAVFPPASVAAETVAEPVTVAQAEPLPVSVAPVEPIAAVAAEPIAVLPATPIVVTLPGPVTAAQPEPLPVSFAPAEPIAVVPREPIGAIPPAPVAVMPPKPKPVAHPEPTPATPPSTTTPTRATTTHPPQDAGDDFLHGLSTLNRSWRRIETMQEEMDEWFKQRRRQALAQAATPPGMRNSSLGANLVQDLSEKMAAIDAQWAEIRDAALGISRAVGDVPDNDQNK